MDDYKNMIYKMLKDNISQEYIMAYVLKKGYQGSPRYLREIHEHSICHPGYPNPHGLSHFNS